MGTVLLLMACASPMDADAARGWSRRHEGTLFAMDTQVERLLAALPSLPGDRFFCRETLTPPGFVGDEAALREMLCRQQRPEWDLARHEAEEELGTALLNGAFLQFGVVGADLSIAGPPGSVPAAGVVEWADHRGVWQFADPSAVPAATSGIVVTIPPPPGGEEVSGKLGWGLVDTANAEENATRSLQPAFEWLGEVRRREATATFRLFVLAEGTPNVAFVRDALDRADAPAP